MQKFTKLLLKYQLRMKKGKIIDIIEFGYKLGDKIIRYPKVVVGN
jgi:molecular chaperone GrpE